MGDSKEAGELAERRLKMFTTDLIKPQYQQLQNNNEDQQLQNNNEEILDLHKDLHDDTKKLDTAKRRLKLFTGSLWEHMKHNIEETIKQAQDSSYVPVSTKTKLVGYGVDQALNAVHMVVPIPGIVRMGEMAVTAGGKMLAGKYEQNLGARGAKNFSEHLPNFKHSEKEIKKLVTEFAFEVVTSYNVQFCEVIDCPEGKEEKLMLKLADEIIGRIFCSLSEAKNPSPIKEVKDLVKPFLVGKNPSPRKIEPREFRDKIFLKKGNSGMTTSDIFKRPGIYHEGKAHVRKKYKNDEKQTRMYHRHPLPGEHWQDDKDLEERDYKDLQKGREVKDLFDKLQAKKVDLLKDLAKHIKGDHEKLGEQLENLGQKMEEVIEAPKDLGGKMEEVGEAQKDLGGKMEEVREAQKDLGGKMDRIVNHFVEKPKSVLSEYFLIVSLLNDLCLGLDSGELTMMDNRSGGDRVLWKWEGKSLINKTGLAMDLEGNIKKAGTRVLGWVHHGQINQQWNREGKHIRCGGNNLVLDIFNSDMNPGARVQAWSKNRPNTSNQMWDLVPCPDIA